MKGTLAAVLLAGAVVCAVVLAVLTPPPPADWTAYQALWRAMASLPRQLPEVEALGMRADAVGWEAQIAAARAHASLGEYSIAADWMAKAMELLYRADLQQELATLLEAAGRRAEACAAWRKLLPRSEAVDGVRRLESDPQVLAGMLLAAGRPTEALSLTASDGTASGLLIRGRALTALGRTTDAIAAYREILAKGTASDTVRLEFGRLLERSGALEQALEVYTSLGAVGAAWAGALLEGLGRLEEAAASYLRSTDPESRWRGARLLEDLGKQEDALNAYLELASGTSRVRDDATLRAFLIEQERGDTFDAAKLAASFPSAFRWMLGLSIPEVAMVGGRPAATESVRLADALLRQRSLEWAEASLDFALRNSGSEERWAIAAWYARHGDAHRAYEIATPLLSALPSRSLLELSYPRTWWREITRWSRAYEVDPLLVLAVIREESNFLPTAVSSSDARGLMQLLPSTARWIAESKLGLDYEEDDLFVPAVNIRLGTWYLGSLLVQFGGDIERAVAAYNGGPGNVTRWTSSGSVDRTAFPGVIALSETREYLVKVLNAWLVYRQLYSS